MDLAAFHQLVLDRCGIVFPEEKAALLHAGVEKRMTARRLSSPVEYLAALTASADEFERLVDLVTVNETYFFREPAHLTLLSEHIAPALLASRPTAPLHVLSAGCSTGEEPYSIAIALAGKLGWASYERFLVTGVDIDTTVLARAREGVYGRNAFRGEGWPHPDWISKSFETCGDGQYRVRAPLRSRVEFSKANLLTGTFPAGLSPDVIFYRNVSLYFPPDVKRIVFGRLAELLAPGGTLFVGASETPFHDLGILKLEAVEGAFVFRKPSGAASAPAPRPRCAAPAPPSRRAVQRSATPPPPSAGAETGRPRGGGVRPEPGADPVFERALAHARTKRYDRAVAELDAVSAADPRFVRAQTLKGCVLLEAGRIEAARGACSAALSADAFCREALLLLGIAAKQERREEEAIQRFREAVYVDPSCWLAHFHLAELHAGRRENDRALQEYAVTVRLLGKGRIADHGLSYFPHAFNAEHVITLCRHASSKLVGTPTGSERP